MSHLPRWIPEKTLVEVSTRTFQGRYFLKPTDQVRQIVLGVVGRAQRMYSMDICLITFMSNHYHMLLVPQDARQLARFMGFINGQIAKKILPLLPWKGKFWDRPFDLILVTDEPQAQRARFRYLSSHGVKEGLVERPEQWIGVHGIDAWLKGERLIGYWFDKMKETRAKRRAKNRGRRLDPREFRHREEVVLVRLPCWSAEGSSEREIREEIAAMVEEIVTTHRLERILAGRVRLAGVEGVLAKAWDHQPAESKTGRRPLFHFRSKGAFEVWRSALADFLAAYRRASSALRSSEKRVWFPQRCFPPAGPFILADRVVEVV